jgi:hypothetical protein
MDEAEKRRIIDKAQRTIAPTEPTLEELKKFDQADLADYFRKLRERNQREMTELQADMERRAAMAAEPLRYSEPRYTRDPEPETNSREFGLTEWEIARIKAAASVDWRGVISEAIAEARDVSNEAIAQFVVEIVRDEREQIERAFCSSHVGAAAERLPGREHLSRGGEGPRRAGGVARSGRGRGK